MLLCFSVVIRESVKLSGLHTTASLFHVETIISAKANTALTNFKITQILTVIINGTVLIISNMKDIWKNCSQMFPWKEDSRHSAQVYRHDC